MLYIKSSDLIDLTTETLYLLTSLCLLPYLFQTQAAAILLLEFNFFFFFKIPRHFLIISLYFTPICALQLLYIHAICMAEILYNGAHIYIYICKMAFTFPAVCTVDTAVVGIVSIYQTHSWLWGWGGRVRLERPRWTVYKLKLWEKKLWVIRKNFHMM